MSSAMTMISTRPVTTMAIIITTTMAIMAIMAIIITTSRSPSSVIAAWTTITSNDSNVASHVPGQNTTQGQAGDVEHQNRNATHRV